MNKELLAAAEKGSYLKVCLNKGADVNTRDKDGWTALMRAAEVGHAAIVQALLDENADVNVEGKKSGGTALMWAAWHGHTAIVKALLSKGANVNIKSYSGKTALMAAAFNDHTEIIALLKQAEEINSKFLTAVIKGNIDNIHDVLNKGANINAKNMDGHTALMLAARARKCNVSIVQTLLAKGADVNVKDKYGNTALVLALYNDRAQIVTLLKQAGAKE